MSPLNPAQSRAFRDVRGARGFTLIELLVALTGGLFVSIAVFTLARDASRFYQREGRLAAATLAAVTGFDRLRGDIARAGFLATPNALGDPLVCSRGTGGTALMQDIASVNVVPGGSPTNTLLTANGRSPDALILAGSYSSTDMFPVARWNNVGTGYVATLQDDMGAMARLGWATATNQADRTALLQTVFLPGRGLRLVDTEGRQHFALITGAAADATGKPQITLSQTPVVQERDPTRLCGTKGLEVGSTVNVVNFIRYDVRSLAGSAYQPLLTASAANASSQLFENNRTELVRRELSAAAADRDTTLSIANVPQIELAAEYAVDLQFEVTVAQANPTLNNPSLSHVGRTAAEATSFQGFVGVPSAGGLPQRIRSVRARLSVRSREGDREAATSKDTGGRLYRFGLGVGGAAGGPFARVRTMQADIILNNNTNVMSW